MEEETNLEDLSGKQNKFTNLVELLLAQSSWIQRPGHGQTALGSLAFGQLSQVCVDTHSLEVVRTTPLAMPRRSRAPTHLDWFWGQAQTCALRKRELRAAFNCLLRPRDATRAIACCMSKQWLDRHRLQRRQSSKSILHALSGSPRSRHWAALVLSSLVNPN